MPYARGTCSNILYNDMSSIDYIFILDLISMLYFAKNAYKNNLPYNFSITIENKYHKIYLSKDVYDAANELVKKVFYDMDNCYKVSNINNKENSIIITFSIPLEEDYFNVSTI